MKEKVMIDLKLKNENVRLLNAKHYIQEEVPSTINMLITDFLKKDVSS